jgi:hypothetical protein
MGIRGRAPNAPNNAERKSSAWAAGAIADAASMVTAPKVNSLTDIRTTLASRNGLLFQQIFSQ